VRRLYPSCRAPSERTGGCRPSPSRTPDLVGGAEDRDAHAQRILVLRRLLGVQAVQLALQPLNNLLQTKPRPTVKWSPVPLGFSRGTAPARREERLSPFRTLSIVLLAIALSATAGGFAYFIPAAVRPGTRQRRSSSSVAVPTGLLFSPSPSPSPQSEGAFTVLLLGSDDTQSSSRTTS